MALPMATQTLAAEGAGESQVAKATIMRAATPHDRLFDIEFVGSRGWSVGDFGAVLRTDDGGVNWETLAGIGDSALLGVDFVDKQRGVVVGTMGVTFFTEDGGDTWTKSKSDYEGRSFSVDITESGFGLAVGEFGAIIRTQDLGHSWTNITPNYEKVMGQFEEPHLYDVIVDSQGTVFVFGEFNTILRSSDQGTTWDVLRKGDSQAVAKVEGADDPDAIGVESLFSAHFIDDNRGWVSGQSGLILYTGDGGNTWEKQANPSTTLLMDIWVSQEGEGVAIGMRTMVRTKDFGKSWYAVKGAPVTDRWYQALAMGEAMLHIEGQTDESGEKTSPSMTTVSSPVYAVGVAGLIVRLDE
jgi:photosystem II stability/assembly factor-like uncharacterized protein